MKNLYNIFVEKGHDSIHLQLPERLSQYTINITTGEVTRSDGKKKTTTSLSSGYQRVAFYTNGQTEYHYVHRLIAYAITGKILPSTDIVMHLDENKKTNNFTNLAIGTSLENSQCPLTRWKNRHRSKREKKQPRRRLDWRLKLSKSRNPYPLYQITTDGEIVAKYDTLIHAAEALGVKPNSIVTQMTGHRKTIKGFKFLRENQLKKIPKNMEILDSIFN